MERKSGQVRFRILKCEGQCVVSRHAGKQVDVTWASGEVLEECYLAIVEL